MMDWRNGEEVGGMDVKVMTDDQMELLRRQISVYATICEQLVQMHNSVSAQQDLSGMKLGNLYCDPFMVSPGHKITARQRWTPTPMQLQILESIFDQGNGNPIKQRITDITTELAQHGHISETNVYNWFQNRRARSKRRQRVPAQNGAESEMETEVESPKEKKMNPENIQSHENSVPSTERMCFHSPEIGAEMLCFDLDAQPSEMEHIFPSYYGLKSSGGLDHTSVMPNPRSDLLIHKIEVPGSFRTMEDADTGQDFY